MAAARMAGLRSSGTWGSALTAGEFAAIRSVGFEPVGQVFGAAVYSAGPASGYSPPRRRDRPASGRRPGVRAGRPGVVRPAGADHGPGAAPAVGRMITECAGLGGHGVVGVRLSRGSFPLGGPQFTALGTTCLRSVPRTGHRCPSPARCPGPHPPAKLIMTGWVPAGLVLGISIGSRHDDRPTARQARWGPRNAEVARPAPNWSASRGTMPGASWKVMSGGSAPMAW